MLCKSNVDGWGSNPHNQEAHDLVFRVVSAVLTGFPFTSPPNHFPSEAPVGVLFLVLFEGLAGYSDGVLVLWIART